LVREIGPLILYDLLLRRKVTGTGEANNKINKGKGFRVKRPGGE